MTHQVREIFSNALMVAAIAFFILYGVIAEVFYRRAHIQRCIKPDEQRKTALSVFAIMSVSGVCAYWGLYFRSPFVVLDLKLLTWNTFREFVAGIGTGLVMFGIAWPTLSTALFLARCYYLKNKLKQDT